MPAVVRMVDNFPKVTLAGNMGTKKAVLDYGARIENSAKAHSRVDTGAMRNGWQMVDLTPARVAGSFIVEVYNPLHYTIHNEFGTVYMTAQPMLRPAVEEHHAQFLLDVKRAWG